MAKLDDFHTSTKGGNRRNVYAAFSKVVLLLQLNGEPQLCLVEKPWQTMSWSG